MKTYKITARTNGYIASRDFHFPKGKTSYTVVSGLSEDEAKKELERFFLKDYDGAIFIESEKEYICELLFSKIEEHAGYFNLAGNVEKFYEATSNRWKIYYEGTVNKRNKFTGPGYYFTSEYYGCLFRKGDESYEYDSRFYAIEEETEE